MSVPTRALLTALLSPVVLLTPALSAQPANAGESSSESSAHSLRVATYNASLNRSEEGQLAAELEAGNSEQIKNVATLIQAQNPDVLVINEFDYDPTGASLDQFNDNYLTVSQQEHLPGVDYPYRFSAPVNTGVDSGLDLDGNAVLGEANDAYGFGLFPGQYGMAVFSKYPLDVDSVRTFQNLLWDDMPGSLLPYDYYGENAGRLRLSSKSHWDLPVEVNGQRIHLLVSHPTPPSFDGPEKRNGRRNSDEIRLTADYIEGGDAAQWITDDEGTSGGLEEGAEFIVLGDQNSDPFDGGHGFPAIDQLLEQPRVVDPHPTANGGVHASAQEGNSEHAGPPAQDTADFSDPEPGNLRADYVLPSDGLRVIGSRICWPAPGEPYSELMDPEKTSDHRMVILDLAV